MREPETTSPPASSWRTEARASGASSATRWKTEAVSQRMEMRAERMVWVRFSREKGPGGRRTRWAPLRRGPQTSRVEASKARGECWRTRSSDDQAMKGLSRTRRTTDLCSMSTPLGRPVEPEV